MSILISTVDRVPCEGFGTLLVDSLSDGHNFVKRLEEDWTSGANRFSGLGEVLLAAQQDKFLLAIGGLNIDPYVHEPGIGRIRHLYVHRDFRRAGVGRQLAEKLIALATDHFDRLTLRTENPSAFLFYESLGFQKVKNRSAATHEMVLQSKREG